MRDLAGKRILIVEDEYFIAADLKHAFDKAHAEIVGPVGDLQRGLELAGTEALDAAILDVGLASANAYPIARELAQRSVPFMFLTGYEAGSLPPGYRSIPRMTKPCPMPRLIELVGELVA